MKCDREIFFVVCIDVNMNSECQCDSCSAAPIIINPRRACAARVTVVGLCVSPSVRPSFRLSVW